MASFPVPFFARSYPDAPRPEQASVAHVSLAFAFACVLSFAVFPDVWRSMVRVWSNSETFAHGFIAVPCAAWMLWRRRDDWSGLRPHVWWPGSTALVACGVIWLAGRLGGVASLEQFGAVGFIPATMLLIAGPALARALAFPLAFLFFAVPVGEFLTPTMMDYTADATVAALRWTGIPVFREGLHFSLPTGRWSVVEACSGLRYLIASLALGVLYAYLQFRTLRYRLAIVALAIVLPIVANWVRAYGIVLLGHLSDMRIAAGADHLIYGWIFFGFVMALLFWIGSRWHEPPAHAAGNAGAAADPTATSVATPAESAAPDPDRSGPASATSPAPPSPKPARRVDARLAAGAALALVAAVAWRPLAASLLDVTQPVDAVAVLQASVDAFPPAEALDFEPRFADAIARLDTARLVGGGPVDVHAFYYARQHETKEMIHDGHRVVRSNDFDWPVVSRGTRRTPWGSAALYVIGRAGSPQFVVWHWYAVPGLQTASEYRAKAATAWSLARGRGDHSLAFVLVTPLRVDPAATRDESMRSAAQRLRTVADALQPAIEAVVHGRAAGAHAPGDASARGLDVAVSRPIPGATPGALAR